MSVVSNSILVGLDDGFGCDDLSGAPLLGNAPAVLWDGTPLQDMTDGGIEFAWRFDGTNAAYIPDYTFGHVRGNEAFSVSCRFRIDTIPNDGSGICLLKRGDVVSEWQILAFKIGGIVSVQFVVWNEAGGIFAAQADNVSVGAWHSLAVVYDRAHLIVYLDGTPHQGDALTVNVRRSNSLVQIGRELDTDGNPQQHFVGAIDEINFFSRALVQSEVTALQTDRPFPYGTREGLAPVAYTTEQRIEADLGPTISAYVQEARNDAGQGRFRRTAEEDTSDVLTNILGWLSINNGRTYGDPFGLIAGTVNYPGGGLQENDSVGWRFDPASGLFLRLRELSFTLDQHSYAKTLLQGSPDGGRTWPLTGDTLYNWPLYYEAGPQFDPNNTIYNTAWKENNNANPGSNIWPCVNGDLITACGGCRDPITGMWGSALGTDCLGARLFRLRWNPVTHNYDVVSISNAVSIDASLTTYGLGEFAVAEILDPTTGLPVGIIAVARNDNTQFPQTAPQGHYVCFGSNEGATLSQPVLWTFDTGAAFACPAATPFLIRLPGSGKLYFIGNVTAIPGGQTPRWPLVAVEIDETLSLPKPKRGTLTRLRRRAVRPVTQPLQIQFSNVTLIVGQDGWTVEGNLTTRGDAAPADPDHGAAWHHKWAFNRPPAGVDGLDAAAQYFFIEHGGPVWNRKLGKFDIYDEARRSDFAIGRTPGKPGALPGVGFGRFNIRQFVIQDGKLSPSSGDVELASFTLDVSIPDAPKAGGAGLTLGPAGTAGVK